MKNNMAVNRVFTTSLVGFFVLFLQHSYGENAHTRFYFKELAERMPIYAGRRNIRPEDPSNLVAHFFHGDFVSIDLCVAERSRFRLDNITHANDGVPDTVEVGMDGQDIAIFRTANHSNWGILWNTFNGTGILTDYLDLDVGRHTITLFVSSSDCYGLELGTIYASVETNSGEPKVRWCGSTFVFANISEECSEVIPFQPIQTPAPISQTPTLSTATGPLPGSSTTPEIAVSVVPVATSPTKRTASFMTTQGTLYTSTVSSTPTVTTTETQLESPTTTGPTSTVPLTFEDVHVTQSSFKTECIDTINVKVGFSVPSLTGVRVVSKQGAGQFGRDVEDGGTSKATTCRDNEWQLGEIDGQNDEFSLMIPKEDFRFVMDGPKEDAAFFPGQIYPNLTKKIEIQFQLKADKRLDSGSVYFLLALVNVTDVVTVGLQYTAGKTNVLSDVHNVTFTSKYRTLGWNLNNMYGNKHDIKTLILHFDTSANFLSFDFMRLDFVTVDIRKKNVVLSSAKTIRIRGLQSALGGMTVDVDKKRKGKNIEKVQLLYRQGIWEKFHNVLSVLSDGRIFPYHRNLLGESDLKNGIENRLVDVSGFVASSDDVDPTHNPVKHVDIQTETQLVTLTFTDGSELSFHLIPTETETQIFILDFSLPNSADFSDRTIRRRKNITFVSTHVTDYLAAVNDVVIDGMVDVPIMSELSVYSGRHVYTFRKTSPTKLFHASSNLELIF